jgi:hypothetical protein
VVVPSTTTRPQVNPTTQGVVVDIARRLFPLTESSSNYKQVWTELNGAYWLSQAQRISCDTLVDGKIETNPCFIYLLIATNIPVKAAELKAAISYMGLDQFVANHRDSIRRMMLYTRSNWPRHGISVLSKTPQDALITGYAQYYDTRCPSVVSDSSDLRRMVFGGRGYVFQQRKFA